MKRNLLKTILCSLLVITLLAAPMSALAASKVAYIFKVSVPGAPGSYLRSGSVIGGGEESEIIGSLKNGAKVIYWGKKIGQMLRVITPDGTVGYVYQYNLKPYGAVSSKQVYLTTAKTGMYKRSGTLKKVLGKNQPVFVYRVNGKWAMIKNLSGTTGYVKMSALKKAF